MERTKSFRLLKKIIFALTIASICFSNVIAQEATDKITVQGTVKSDSGEPLIGVSVLVVNTDTGVSTDLYGNYRLTVKQGATLRFSYLGFQTRNIKVSKEDLDVTLIEDIKSLNEVIITGYSQKELRKSTGSVGVLNSDQIKDAPLNNIDKLLQGKLAGVSVTSQSGRPGTAAKIRIRGTSTITGNAEPLWVVDGVPLQKDIPPASSSYIKSGDFSDIFATGVGGINPLDIESITVLKDAAAAAIYGSRASGGVIVVVTKKGKAGDLRINYSGSVSLQTSPQRNANLMSSSQKIAYEESLWSEFSKEGYEASQNGGVSAYYPRVGLVGIVRSGYGQFKDMSLEERNNYLNQAGESTTDWFDALFRNSISTNHHLSLSGGSEKTTYYISGGYSQNNGLVLRTDYESYHLNAKINANPSSKISFGLTTDFSYQNATSPSNNVNMFNYAYFANPYEKPYNPDGSYAADQTYFMLSKVNGGFISIPPNGFNIFREINETTSDNSSANITLTGNMIWRIINGLQFNGLASFSYIADNSDNINGKDTYASYIDRPFEKSTLLSNRTYGSITQQSAYNKNYLLRGQLNYNFSVGESSIVSLIGGSEIRSSYAKSIFAKRYGYDPVSGNHAMPIPQPNENGDFDYDTMVRYGRTMDALQGQSIAENAFASFYGAFDYIFDNKYIANFSARTDGSNNFGSKEQFNMTWSAGLSWNVDEEEFMKPLFPIISSMTMRLATGYTGGVNKSVYPILIMDYQSTFRTTEDDYYRMGSIRNAPNPHLRWEKTRDVKAALDMAFFKNRLRFLTEIYHRKGMDLVTSVKVPSTTGFTNQSYNTSEQINQGIEFSLSGSIIRREDFKLNASANIAYNRNKLTKYNPPTESLFSNYYVGYPQGKIFIGKTTGINPETGIYNYELRPDAEITDISDYRKMKNYIFYVGTSVAPWTGGLSTSATYKKLTLSVGGSFSINGKVLNKINPPGGSSLVNSGGDGEPIPSIRNDLYAGHYNTVQDAMYRWTESNPVTDGYPRLIDINGPRLYLDRDQPTSSQATDAIFLEDVSYLKISSLSILYTLPENKIKNLGLQNMGITCTMNNLFTFTNYTGIDPEIPGVVYPQSRSFSLGINIGF